MVIYIEIHYLFLCIAECPSHCSLCYNATDCSECTQGYFITENAECQSESEIRLKHYYYKCTCKMEREHLSKYYHFIVVIALL